MIRDALDQYLQEATDPHYTNQSKHKEQQKVKGISIALQVVGHKLPEYWIKFLFIQYLSGKKSHFKLGCPHRHATSLAKFD